MNYLGIDWGRAKIGVALGSDEVKIASPIMVLSYKNIDEIIKKLQELVVQENIDCLVVGQPISLSGEKNLSNEYNIFIKKIQNLGKKIFFEDERMTTKYAQVLKREFAGCKKVADDDLAATAILQSYFDRMN